MNEHQDIITEAAIEVSRWLDKIDACGDGPLGPVMDELEQISRPHLQVLCAASLLALSEARRWTA